MTLHELKRSEPDRETTDVGTRLYIAPEMSVQSSGSLNLPKKDSKKNKNRVVAPRTTAKADMYILVVGVALVCLGCLTHPSCRSCSSR